MNENQQEAVRVRFRTPSLARYRKHAAEIGSHSILRCLEYDRLGRLGLQGRVLDFGGGSRTNYSSRASQWGDRDNGYVYESANIDPRTEPTFLISEDGEIPCEDGRYDHVIALNTLEHVYDVAGTLDRLRRVLREGGQIHIIVPFIFRVHGHPDDYSRGTPSYWTRLLNERGFDQVDIEALTWGPFSTAHNVSGAPGPLKGLRLRLAMLLDVAYFAGKHGTDTMLTEIQDAPACNAPLAYLIQAAKAGSKQS